MGIMAKEADNPSRRESFGKWVTVGREMEHHGDDSFIRKKLPNEIVL